MCMAIHARVSRPIPSRTAKVYSNSNIAIDEPARSGHAGSLRPHRSNNARCPCLVVMHHILRDKALFGELDRERLARIGIWFVERSPGTRDRDTNAVSLIEDKTRPANVKVHGVHLARFHEHFFLIPLAI